MAETSNDNVVEVPPMANVYTVLILVAAVALVVGIAAAGNRLMSKENGYGMEPAQLFELPEQAPVSSGEPGE
jgi:hypothetical protein